MKVLWLCLLLLAAGVVKQTVAVSSTSPVWVASSFFKAGAVTFVFSSSTSTVQNTTVIYSSAITNTNLKVPTLGITDLGYKVQSGDIMMLVVVVRYTQTYLIFKTEVNANSRLNTLKITYMALDSSFTPAFSMNYFFPNINKNGSAWSVQYFVNFTASTGVLLNTSHDNALLPFMHYIECTSYDNTIDLQLDFSLVNGSFYRVTISTTSNIYIRYAGFSRLIFDKTAIEAMGSDYFNYGIVSATGGDALQLKTNIPPDIIPENLFYGLHSLNMQDANNWIDFTSSYTINTGDLQLTPVGSFVFTDMKYSYMHHKTRTCPATHPYYNISEVLCYDQCAVGWYGDVSTMTCQQCLYDCFTCSNGTACATCDSTVDHRIKSLNRCPAGPGYYDTGVNDPVAAPCTSPCATCVTSATYCLSCVTGYYLSSSSCLSCSAAIPSCNQCSNSSFCQLCSDGSNGISCTPCLNTQFKNTTSGLCVSCASVVTNCLSCTSQTSCTLCQTSFTLFTGTNCSCNTSQYLSGSTCSLCSGAISYCQSCNDASTCTSCKTTFTLLSATNCACNSTTFLNTGTQLCSSCTLVTPYCNSCTSTTCTGCVNNLTLDSGTCGCTTGYYANSTSEACQSCGVMAHCLQCSDVSTCTVCATGYKVNTMTNQCDVQPCTVSNCDTCLGASLTFCESCYKGYSITSTGQCLSYCGNAALALSQQCDDGNTISGDGCSSTCTLQSGFSCYQQTINSTNSYSWCFYTSAITFQTVWIRKYEGNNSLKLQFKLDQQIQEWANVDFRNILGLNQVDKSSRVPTGNITSMVQYYDAGYIKDSNRFWVIIDYVGVDMENQWISFELTPYAHNAYKAFTPPNNIEYNPTIIMVTVEIKANNNQNANLYSQYTYSLYKISVTITYIVVGMALGAVLASVAFGKGFTVAVEMIVVMQITYFSLASLDSINPVFSGLLPLRYLAGILTFNGVEEYLEQTSSPNAMKGIYMFLNLSSNFSWVAVGLISFIILGAILLAINYLLDHCNEQSLQDDIKSPQERNHYWLYRLSFFLIGDLSLSLIYFCLPIYTVSLFFQALFTMGSSQLWSYAEGAGVGVALICYFTALLKADQPKPTQLSKLGEYITEYNMLGCFKTLKYVNWQLLQILIISGLVMATIYSNNKIFSAFCICIIAVIDIVVVAVIKPYRFGFISCFKGEDNDTETLFEKIELYKVYDKEQPSIIRIENPDFTQKSQENQNNSEVFAQHFATKKNIIKSRHQGLVQAGETLRQTKLFLFNHNTRRIIDLVTLVLVQFVFICTKIYAEDINKSYDGPTIQNTLPLLIHCVLFLNVFYNYCMLFLQILNRTRDSIAKVDIQPDSSSQFNKSIYTQNIKQQSPTLMNNSALKQSTIKTNKLIIKENGTAVSLYDLKRPQIIKSQKKERKNKMRTNNVTITD